MPAEAHWAYCGLTEVTQVAEPPSWNRSPPEEIVISSLIVWFLSSNMSNMKKEEAQLTFIEAKPSKGVIKNEKELEL